MVEFKAQGLVISIEIDKQLKPSDRGKLGITSVNKTNLERGDLNMELHCCNLAWLDTGTHDSHIEVGVYVQTIEKR